MTLSDYEAKYGRRIPRSFGGVAPVRSKGFGGEDTVMSSSRTSTTNSNNNTKNVTAESNHTKVSRRSENKMESLAPPPPSPIFKYHIRITYVFSMPNGNEALIEFSKINPDESQLEINKNRCVRIYKKVIEECEALRQGGPFYYDRQSALYSCTEIPMKKISLTVTEGVSRRPNFIRAEFTLERSTNDNFTMEMLSSMPAKCLEFSNSEHHFLITKPTSSA